jgi:hypothetical protein
MEPMVEGGDLMLQTRQLTPRHLGYLHRNAGLKEVRPLFSKQQDRVARVSVSADERRRLALLQASLTARGRS